MWMDYEFFFFKQKTAYEMRISDWSSDVCSSDLVKDGGTDAERDMLYAWVQEDAHKSAILFDEDVRPELVQQVVGHYAADLTDDELEAIGRDPFLIARALADPGNRCIVTTEVSKRRLQRQNRRIPDVCADAGVQCCDTFAMLRALRFRTGWRS